MVSCIFITSVPSYELASHCALPCAVGTCGVEDTLPTEGNTAIAAFNYSVVCYIHQCRNNGSHQRGDERAHHRPYINTYIYIHATTTTADHHHTVQVARAKWSMCTSGWKEKDHQRKLQRVMLPRVQILFVPIAEGKMPPTPVRTRIAYKP